MNAGNGPNFEDLLDQSPTEVRAPGMLPEGPYVFLVKMPDYVTANSGNKGTKFHMQPVGYLDGVDEEALTKALNGDALADRELDLTFWHTDKSIYRLDDFHVHCGCDLNDGATRKQRNEMIIGSQVVGYVKHVESNKQPGRFFANIVSTAPVIVDSDAD
jgi:hypothetical protein